MVNQTDLPDKIYFKIGEVAKLLGVKQHVLRYWESEFSCVNPQKSKTQQRLYRRKDVEALIAVRHLLYDLKFTIEGARRHLKDEGVEASLPAPDAESLVAVAKKEMEAQQQQEIDRVRAAAKRSYEEQLLFLKSMAEAFINELDGGFRVE